MISLRKSAWMIRHPRRAWNEIKTVRELAASTPDFSEKPWLDDEDIIVIKNCLDKEKAMVEYGSGSSTFHFAPHAHSIHSVDTSDSYVRAVRAEGARRGIQNINLTAINVGPVRAWGWPIDDFPTPRNMANWRRYLEAPWATLKDTPLSLVLVDGRFRVSCAAYAIGKTLERGEKVPIILDDFVGRESHYGKLGDIAKLTRTAGRAVIVEPLITSSEEAIAFAERNLTDLR